MSLAPRPLHKNYDVMRQLGHGAMAEVLLAKRRLDDTFVAVKRALPHLAQNRNIAVRFEEETRVMPHLSHPNIVRTLEICEDENDGSLAIVLEFVDGPSLLDVGRAALARSRPIAPACVAHIGGELLSALGYLHDAEIPGGQRGVVHRDVTPSNILIRQSGTACLIDFGVAFATGRQALTKTGAMVGKIGYMAPEVLAGERGGPSADLFGTAVLLYEMLCARSPFAGNTAAEVVEAVVAGRVTPPSEYLPTISDALSSVLLRGLATKIEDRFEDAWEMAMDLSAALPMPDPADAIALIQMLTPEQTGRSASPAFSQPSTEDGSSLPEEFEAAKTRPVLRGPPTTTTDPAAATPTVAQTKAVVEHTVTQVAPPAPPLPDRASAGPHTQHDQTKTVVTPASPDVTVTQVAPSRLNTEVDER